MSIFSCPVPYFSLTSGGFWTFLLFFSALCPFSPARFRISLWLPNDFGLFPYFSLFYVHMEEYRSLRTAMNSEVSRLRRVQKPPDCEKHGSLKTAMSSEASNLRRVQKSPNCDEFRSLQTAMSSEASNLRRVQKSPNYDEHGSLQPA